MALICNSFNPSFPCSRSAAGAQALLHVGVVDVRVDLSRDKVGAQCVIRIGAACLLRPQRVTRGSELLLFLPTVLVCACSLNSSSNSSSLSISAITTSLSRVVPSFGPSPGDTFRPFSSSKPVARKLLKKRDSRSGQQPKTQRYEALLISCRFRSALVSLSTITGTRKSPQARPSSDRFAISESPGDAV